MPFSLQISTHLRQIGITGVLSILPLLASAVFGSALRNTPPLDRRETPKRTLQFAQYCYNHGPNPVREISTLNSRFRFRNVGSETIELGHIERSCGCLTPELSHRQLKSGEMGEMKVSVPLEEQSAGFHEFQLTVHYRDPQPRHETVLIKAVFPEPQILVTPRAISVSQRGPVHRPVTHQFTIADHRSRPLRVESVESSSPWVDGSIKSVENGGRLTQIRIDIQGGIPAGKHHMLIHAQTDDPGFPAAVMLISVTGPERPVPVLVRPSRLQMRADDPTARVIEMQVPTDWQISHVACFPPEMLCEWRLSPGASSSERQSVILSLTMSAPPVSRTREGVVTLYANDSMEMVSASVGILAGSQQSAADAASTQSGQEYSSN